MKKKSFTQFLCISFSAMACALVLSGTLPLSGSGQPKGGNAPDDEIGITNGDGHEGNPDSGILPGITEEPGIMPLGDWEDESDKRIINDE